MKKVTGIVLYHGSLKELNSQVGDGNYLVASPPFYISKFYGFFKRKKWIRQITNNLKEDGIEGLVNVRTIGGLFANSRFAAIEGTPIFKNSK